MSLVCHFKFKEFPLDTQFCTFQVTNQDAQYLELILPVEKNLLSKNFTKDGFDITAKFGQGKDCDGRATSCIEVEFIMRRIRSTFVFQYSFQGLKEIFYHQDVMKKMLLFLYQSYSI